MTMLIQHCLVGNRERQPCWFSNNSTTTVALPSTDYLDQVCSTFLLIEQT